MTTAADRILVDVANLVATMQAYDIPKLLTHNVADFRRFEAMITIVPIAP